VFDYASPYGRVRLIGAAGGLCRVVLGARGWRARTGAAAPPPLRPYVLSLRAYFEQGKAIECGPEILRACEVSPFERSVYEALLKVAFGATVSYGELARRCARQAGARAVGRALAANPLPIFIPCHRVVRADGRIGGFGAGLLWKRRLLRHEGLVLRDGRVAEGT